MSLTITVNSEAPEIEDGVYPLTLTKIEETTIVPKVGPDAGKELDKFRWHFATDDGIELDVLTSKASGPKSKMFEILTALLDGRPPTSGQQFTAEQLLARQLLGTINKNENGWPKIVGFSAMPKQMQQQRFAAATGTPIRQPAPAAAPAPASVRQQVAGEAQLDADLPF